MGHDMKNRLGDHRARAESLFNAFYPAITRDQLLHILNYLRVTDSDEEIGKNTESYERMWKIIEI